ncbi:MAG TPA: alpha-L-rhamnosidase C-terminal domain-containing protein [Trebonia sp.]|nr:alpha-L-rhamnosidase C-terminal domain-containing protein [Trebonia sp.]
MLGIDQAPGSAGFGQLELRPHPSGSLTFDRGAYRSVRGLVGAEWSVSGAEFTYRVSVPPNVTATVHMPGSAEAGIRVGPGRHSFSGPVPLMLDPEERR